MKVCVFGASGYVGASIYEKIKQRQELEVIGTYLEEAVFSNLVRLDVNEAEDFSRFFKKERPDIVIWSVMSGPEEGRVSDQGLIHLITHLEPNTKLIYISSDFVFARGRGPYFEEDTPSLLPEDHPLSNYANAKVKAEKFIQNELTNYLILRCGPIYGKNVLGKKDTHTMQLDTYVQRGESVAFRDDLIRTFVHVEDIADVVDELLGTKLTGILHVGPEKEESFFDFMQKRARHYGLDPKLITRADPKVQQVNSPKNIALVTDRISRVVRTPMRS